RNSIFVFVNGRLIRARLILHAISAAYHNLIPPSCYPFALLFLECDYEEVDVNVHPSKTEVRFRHGSVVHDFVRDAIREQLVASRPVSSVPLGAIEQPGSGQPAAGLPYSEFTQTLENQRMREPMSQPPPAAGVDAPVNPSAGALPDFALRRPQGPAARFDFGAGAVNTGEPSPPVMELKVPETHGPLPDGATQSITDSLEALSDLRPLGQIHDSFIIAAGRDGLWIIDQHVAHERILFEQVLRQQAAGRVQMQQLLMPLVIELTAAQQVEYARISEELHQMGFETEPFGQRTIAVKGAPAGIGQADIERVVFEILEIGDGEARQVSLDDTRRAMAASIACRAAIKINMRLDDSKIRWLLDQLAKTDCPMSCPHGRPIALRYATKEILKGFHRI
ncbi:MAG: DNA mismatch repair protein MutL, partial [bacterium]|nr:DNA mismatch repair protein MutL [bacterium]